MKILGNFYFYCPMNLQVSNSIIFSIYFLVFYCRRCWLGWSGCGLGGLGSFFSSGCWWDSMCWFGWSGCGICGWMLMFNGLLLDFESLSPWSRLSMYLFSWFISASVCVSFLHCKHENCMLLICNYTASPTLTIITWTHFLFTVWPPFIM